MATEAYGSQQLGTGFTTGGDWVHNSWGLGSQQLGTEVTTVGNLF
jgi:hypothetical protein